MNKTENSLNPKAPLGPQRHASTGCTDPTAKPPGRQEPECYLSESPPRSSWPGHRHRHRHSHTKLHPSKLIRDGLHNNTALLTQGGAKLKGVPAPRFDSSQQWPSRHVRRWQLVIGPLRVTASNSFQQHKGVNFRNRPHPCFAEKFEWLIHGMSFAWPPETGEHNEENKLASGLARPKRQSYQREVQQLSGAEDVACVNMRSTGKITRYMFLFQFLRSTY